MNPYTSIYRSKLSKGGDILNPSIFSLISSCVLNLEPDPVLAKIQRDPEDILIKGCLIMQTMYYSIEHDEDFNFSLCTIELQEKIKKTFPKQTLCDILAYQNNPECDKNPLKQKKIQILYKKGFGNVPTMENITENKINPNEIAIFFNNFCFNSHYYQDNKMPELNIEFLQIKILLSKTNKIKAWCFLINEETIDIGDVFSFLKHTYNNIDPLEDKELIENWFKKQPESLYYLYLVLGKVKYTADAEKANYCLHHAKKAARKVFAPGSREILLIDYERFLIDNDEDSKLIRIRRLLRQLQMNFIQSKAKSNELNIGNELKEEIKENIENNEDQDNVNNTSDEDNHNIDSDNEDNEDNEEFHVNPTINISELTEINPIDKIFFAKVLLEQEEITYRSYKKSLEILLLNPQNKERIAFCYYKIAEIMLEIIDERTSYINFFGDEQIEQFSIYGVEKNLKEAYNILTSAFDSYDYITLEVVFEMIRIQKRLKNYKEAYRFMVIATHILRIYTMKDDTRLVKNSARIKKKKPWNRFLALIQCLFVIDRNSALKKILKRKEIIIDLLEKFI